MEANFLSNLKGNSAAHVLEIDHMNFMRVSLAQEAQCEDMLEVPISVGKGMKWTIFDCGMLLPSDEIDRMEVEPNLFVFLP